MNHVKSVLTFMVVGALLGNLVASFAAPHFIEWYNSTPLATQTMCNLPQVVRDVSADLIRTQLIGSGVGAVAFLVLGILFVRSRYRKQHATPPPPAAPTATSV